jgi:hypothetical protein
MPAPMIATVGWDIGGSFQSVVAGGSKALGYQPNNGDTLGVRLTV